MQTDTLTNGQRRILDALANAKLRDGEAKLLTELIRAQVELTRVERALEALSDERREVLADLMTETLDAMEQIAAEAAS